MILSFHPCFEADHQIILGDRGLSSQDLERIQEAEAILVPQTCSSQLYRICSQSLARLFPAYEARYKYPGKTGQKALFERCGCLVPETTCWADVKAFTDAHPDWAELPHSLPFFIKEDRRHEAEGVFLIKDRPSLKRALGKLAVKERSGKKGFVTQAAIPNHGNVLRVVIIGKELIAYWKRPRDPGQVITTVSRGAVIDPDWRPDLQEIGKARAWTFARKAGINLAALDLVFPFAGPESDFFFLEVNYYFGRRGLGGTVNYYKMLYSAVQEWISEAGFDPGMVRLV